MHDDDPDETEGRKLYRQRANAYASAQVNYVKHRIGFKEDVHTMDIEINKRYVFDYPSGLKTLPDYTAHAGQQVRVIRQLREDEADQEEGSRMYEVRADDGWYGHADESELKPIPTPMWVCIWHTQSRWRISHPFDTEKEAQTHADMYLRGIGYYKFVQVLPLDIFKEAPPRIYAMVTEQGTACPETALLENQFNWENRDRMEAVHCLGGPDDPVKGSWIDCTDNEAVQSYMGASET